MSSVDRYTCEETIRRLNDYLDRELSAAEMQMVAEHLATCAACANEFAFEETVLAEVKTKLRRIDVPASLRERIAVLLANPGPGRAEGS